MNSLKKKRTPDFERCTVYTVHSARVNRGYPRLVLI